MPSRPPALAARIALVIVAGAFFFAHAASARADEPPQGPTFGNVHFVGAIDAPDGEADIDTFAAPLIAGERVFVCVTASGRSALQPTLALVDATGADLRVVAVTSRRGRRVALRGHTLTTSSWLGARVAGHAGSEGGYVARFRVRSPRRWRTERVDLGSAAGAVRAIPFQAVDGAQLDARVRTAARGERVAVLRVLAPDGSAVPGLANALRRRGPDEIVTRLTLTGGSGAYSVLVGTDGADDGDGDARGTVRVRVTPPARPRGRIQLAVDEPALQPTATPLPALIGARLTLSTRHAPASPPPRVLIGGVPATVLRVADTGDVVEVRVPETLTPGALATATLIGPDEQASVRPGHVRVVRVDVLDLSGWTLVQTASSRHFTFPAGTVLRTGEHAVVARDAERADFATFWGVTLAPSVRFIQSTVVDAAFPSINGAETFTLLDATGAVVDGPTLPVRSSGHESLTRLVGAPPGDIASWVLAADTPGVPTPGAGGSLAGPPVGVYISEISDAAGSGAFVHEFVELYFAGHPEP